MKQKFRKRYYGIFIVLLLVLLAIGEALYSFNTNVREREYQLQMETMQELSMQERKSLENKLQDYVNSLQSVRPFIDVDDLYGEQNISRFDVIVKETEFTRIGISDLSGQAVTNVQDDIVDISGNRYFQKALTGRPAISESRVSAISEQPIFVVALPLYQDIEKTGDPIGVLFGTIRIDDFDAYHHENASTEHFLQVIDQTGRFILKGSDPQAFFGIDIGDNFYDKMAHIKTDMPVDEIEDRLGTGATFTVEANYNSEEYVAYLAPLNINEWYVVITIREDSVVRRVNHLIDRDLYLLVGKILFPTFVLIMLIVSILQWEKKMVFKDYSQAKIANETLRFALSDQNSVFTLYDSNNDTMQIYNYERMPIQVPEVVKNASTQLQNYFARTEQAKQELRTIFEKIRSDKADGSYPLSIQVDNETHFFRVHVTELPGIQGQYVGIMENITAEVSLSQEISFREQLLAKMIGFMMIDLTENRIIRCSEGLLPFCDETIGFAELVQKLIAARVTPECQEDVAYSLSMEKLTRDYERGIYSQVIEFAGRLTSDEIVWLECEFHLEKDSRGHMLLYFTLRNIDEKKQRELKLAEKADHDFLTGLYNRSGCIDRVNEILLLHPDQKHAFVIFDLDNFKAVNDTFGHQAGDKTLQDVAEILRHHFRGYDVISRLAGDEYVVLMRNIPEHILEKNISTLLEKLNLTYRDTENTVSISASAGVAVTPVGGMTFEDLYKSADAALYRIKESGKNGYSIVQ